VRNSGFGSLASLKAKIQNSPIKSSDGSDDEIY